MDILVMPIDGYSIGEYWWILMHINDYYINGHWWLF
jgi:hypothetical protein